MLTNQDLKKIGELIDGRLDAKLGPGLEKIDEKLVPIHKKLDRIDKKLTVFVDEMDRRSIDHEKRLDRIDTHLKLPGLPRAKPSKKMMDLLGQLAN